MNRIASGLLAAACLATLVLAPAEGSANERHFAYTYESATLPAGEAELEPWTTLRAGRRDFYRRFDHRLEYEMGLTDRLMAALYVNFTSLAAGSGKARTSSFEYEGVSLETKYKLTDPVADAVGSALYFEVTASAVETELEAKAIFDKRFGDFLAAVNLFGEHEWELEEEGTEREYAMGVNVGASYLVTPHFGLGLELRNVNGFSGEEGFSHAAFFGGPALSYAERRWWVSAAVLPQLFAIKSAERDDDSFLELDDQERIQARVLFGFHL